MRKHLFDKKEAINKRSIFFFIAIGLFSFINAQTITTVAGSGTPGFTGDGGAAISAEVNHPYGVAVDATGNIYIADGANHRVRKVNTSGVITTFAGNGTSGYSGDGGSATSAQLSFPVAVTVDGSGNIYIADNNNSCIRKVNTLGIITTAAGNGTLQGYGGDGGPATSAKMIWPYGVALDGSGNIYVADTYNNRVRKVNTSGIISTYAGNGSAGYSGDGGPATSARLNNPWGIAVDGSGNVYIGDSKNNCIRKVNNSGVISTIAGNNIPGFSGDGGLATSAQLNNPTGMTLDASGNLFISDIANNRVRKVNTFGIISTFAGNGIRGFSGDGGSSITAELANPNAVALDGAGNVFVADTGNQRIRKIALLSGVAEQELFKKVSIYPIPSHQHITLEISNDQFDIESAELIITSVLEKEVKREKLVSKRQYINISELESGLYYLQLSRQNKIIFTNKIIKN
jgi:sugar lactone lactonase YvrE